MMMVVVMGARRSPAVVSDSVPPGDRTSLDDDWRGGDDDRRGLSHNHRSWLLNDNRSGLLDNNRSRLLNDNRCGLSHYRCGSHHRCGGGLLDDHCRRVRGQCVSDIGDGVQDIENRVQSAVPALPVIAGAVSLGGQACEQHTDDDET